MMWQADELQKLEAGIQDGTIDPDELYRAQAIAQISEHYDTCTLEVIGAITLGFLLFSVSGWLGAAAIGLMAAQLMSNKAKKGTQAIEAIEAGGADLSPWLPAEERMIYTALKAQPQALPPAQEAIAPDQEAIVPEPVIQPPPTPQEVAESVPAPPASTSENVIPLPQVTLAETQSENPILNYQFANVACKLGERLRPTIVTAKPRVGKGIVVAHGWRWAKVAHPDLTVWVINPKPDHQESGYWHGVDRLWEKATEMYAKDDEYVTQSLIQFVEEWRSQPRGKTLLIVDETIKLEATQEKWYKEHLKPLLKVESSTGETYGRTLWVITQSPQVGDLGLSGGNRSAFDLVTLEKPESMDHFEAIQKSYNNLPQMPPPEILNRTPRRTCAYLSWEKGWYLIPTMEKPAPIEHPTQTNTLVEEEMILLPETTEQSTKLMEWLTGTGQQFAEDGWFTPQTIRKNFRCRVEGKLKYFKEDELLVLLKELVRGGMLAIDKAKGIRVKESL
ncbi:hypothetical protein [Leptolyngbya sp. FACHB-16]|uniref:hypothetical protein n=1 Tax=unclassified Leptolyngbya TaxID=2650499 RepID=UPI00168A03CF|nr:hypothetical protein [Leptolyngbya sp. FACHB-16]MBD2158520.1 hypothetical protein [Leptolyngbya sp. FACHB-16]